MSPQDALHTPLYRAYVLIVCAALILGGLILAPLRWRQAEKFEAVWKTYRSWLIMAPAALLVVFAGRFATIAGATLLAVFAFKEFARASGLYRDWPMTGTAYAGIVGVGIASWVSHPRALEGGTGWYALFMALPVFTVAAVLLVPILRNRTTGQLQRIALAIVGFVYIGWMFGHLGFLANATNAYGYICYVVFATEISDIAAFTFGRAFGRHPLRSQISPGKTWEGAIGALIVSMTLPWALRFSFPFFGAWQLFLTGLIVGVGGQLGDLSISLIKRDIGTKDMGCAIPGHGGILDRIDSLIYVAPLFMHMANYYYGLR